MKIFKTLCFVFTVFIQLTYSPFAAAQTSATQESAEQNTERKINVIGPSVMIEDTDGVLTQNEYEQVSVNNSITRALCPYTCEMRNLPKEHCKTWKSNMEPNKCYVQDLRIPSEAIEFK